MPMRAGVISCIFFLQTFRSFCEGRGDSKSEDVFKMRRDSLWGYVLLLATKISLIIKMWGGVFVCSSWCLWLVLCGFLHGVAFALWYAQALQDFHNLMRLCASKIALIFPTQKKLKYYKYTQIVPHTKKKKKENLLFLTALLVFSFNHFCVASF